MFPKSSRRAIPETKWGSVRGRNNKLFSGFFVLKGNPLRYTDVGIARVRQISVVIMVDLKLNNIEKITSLFTMRKGIYSTPFMIRSIRGIVKKKAVRKKIIFIVILYILSFTL